MSAPAAECTEPRKSPRATAILAVSLLASVAMRVNPAHAQTIVSRGSPIEVSTSPHSSHRAGQIDGAPGRGSVIVWESAVPADGSEGNGGDRDGRGVVARRFDSRGVAIGVEFQVNTYTTGHQEDPRVAMAADGSFAVLWDGDRLMSARSFFGDGSPRTEEFVVAEQEGSQGLRGDTDLEALSDGDYILTWRQGQNDFFGTSEVLTQRIAAAGGTVGPAFQVDTGSIYPVRLDTGIAIGPDDSVLVTWEETLIDFTHAVGRPLDASGAPTGPIFRAPEPLHEGNFPAVAAGEDGRALMVWHAWRSVGDDDSSSSVQGRFVSMNGEVLGAQFQVNTFTTRNQDYSDVCSTRDGGYLVTWRNPGDSYRTYGRYVDADGTPTGSDAVLSEASRSDIPSRCTRPTMLVFREDTLRARLFDILAPLFEDGFESGELDAWSTPR